MNEQHYEDYFCSKIFLDCLLEKMPSLSSLVAIDQNWKNSSTISCSICLDSLQDTSVVFTSCRHLYHKDCINVWWLTSKSCCFCNQKLDGTSLIPATIHQFCANYNEKTISHLIMAAFQQLHKIFYYRFVIRLCLIDRVAWICDTLLEHAHFTNECASILSEASIIFSSLANHNQYCQPVAVWKKRWRKAVDLWQEEVKVEE